MHEMPTILNIVASAERLAKQYGVSKLGYVKIEVGELSSALPRYLKELWPLGSKDSICEGAELLIEEKKAVAQCRDCGREYPAIENLVDNYPVCPYCHSERYSITEGAKVFITELGIPE